MIHNYKVGDVVQIKSLCWYDKNKNESGDIICIIDGHNTNFVSDMRVYCDAIYVIESIGSSSGCYKLKNNSYWWNEKMFTRRIKFKVGDIVKIKSKRELNLLKDSDNEIDNLHINPAVYDCCDKHTTIEEPPENDGTYKLFGFWWNENMIEYVGDSIKEDKKSTYKIGDVVRIKSKEWYDTNKDEHGDIHTSSETFVKSMSDHCGLSYTIIDTDHRGCYTLEGIHWSWTEEMFEPVIIENSCSEINVGKLPTDICLKPLDTIKTYPAVNDSQSKPNNNIDLYITKHDYTIHIDKEVYIALPKITKTYEIF